MFLQTFSFLCYNKALIALIGETRQNANLLIFSAKTKKQLIHSPDFVVPVEIENQVHNVYVIKRPGVDAFMKRMGELYEVVVFTASLSKVSP